ncbi:MAG: HAD-IA family hydrolase [Candidatus Eisenbacteria bacterium]|uniref:HAD-IA family hydrolase n=1 Tax=Eiseniibacteriota bacterium TaxID=2212470 RepID=A0A7Y2ECF1_UNCEI|nr:HAD-IA family hydrolase [Candidatus Eisenbacteria bacterium]
MIRAVIFDLDNTLTDFMGVKQASIRGAVDAMLNAGLDQRLKTSESTLADQQEAIAGEISRIYDREGIEYQLVFNRYLEETLGEVDYKFLAAAIWGYRRARDSHLVPYPHVHLTIHQLAKMGLKLAVVSDAPREPAWLRLVYLNLHHLFDAVVTFEDTGVRKPEKEPFVEALRRLEVAPEETLMIGDWPDRDVAGASALGMVTVFARYGYSWSRDRAPIEEHPPNYEIDDISELVGIVEKLKLGTR